MSKNGGRCSVSVHMLTTRGQECCHTLTQILSLSLTHTSRFAPPERFYGALTGLNKTQTAERLGEELVQGWRGSLRSRPPELTEQDQVRW